MHVTMLARPVTEERRGLVINRYLGTMTDNAPITVERTAYRATVDGVPWTEAQTMQAVRDSGVCRCGDCACCLVGRAYAAARFPDERS